jgi:MFS family permease
MDLLGRIREDMAFEGNVWKSYLYRFLMNFQLWWPIWVLYLQDDRGLSLTQITLLDVPFFLLVVAMEVPTGAVADRWGRRYSLMLGSLMFSIAVFVFGIAESYPLLLLSYTAWGFGLTFQSGADTAILYDSLKAIDREDDFQKINSRMWALTSAAVLVAILIGAPIASATSFSYPIILSALISICAVPVAFSMHEPKHERDDEYERYFQMVRTGIVEAWRAPALRYIILFSGIIGAAVFAPMIFIQPFLDEHGVNTENLGYWQAPVRGAGVIAALLVAQFVARVGQRASFAAMPVAVAIAMLALAGVDELWAYGVFLAVGMVAGSMNPILASYVNKRIPSERRATMLSVQSVVASLILAGVEPATGALADLVGLQGMFLAVAAMTVVAGGGTLLLWDQAERQDQRDESGGATPLREPEPVREPVAVS